MVPLPSVRRNRHSDFPDCIFVTRPTSLTVSGGGWAAVSSCLTITLRSDMEDKFKNEMTTVARLAGQDFIAKGIE